MWTVDYYETATGYCPTKEFLDKRHKEKELPAIQHDIDRLAIYGFELKRPYADTLRDGIHELRTKIGHVNYRMLYFFFYDEKIIITNGCTKIIKVAETDINKAIKYKNDYFSRYKRKK
jgi:putative component of toxin-antitoxin plasmid stabilization module